MKTKNYRIRWGADRCDYYASVKSKSRRRRQQVSTRMYELWYKEDI